MTRQPQRARAVRVSDRLWSEAQRVAGEREETVSEVIRRALEAYVERYGTQDALRSIER